MDKTLTKYLDNIIEDVVNGGGDSDKHLMTLFSIAIGMKSKKILNNQTPHHISFELVFYSYFL